MSAGGGFGRSNVRRKTITAARLFPGLFFDSWHPTNDFYRHRPAVRASASVIVSY